MYILKNSVRNITRNKGKNFLIGIILVVIGAAWAITLAIRQSANNIVSSYEKENKCVIIVTHSKNVSDKVDEVYELKKVYKTRYISLVFLRIN